MFKPISLKNLFIADQPAGLEVIAGISCRPDSTTLLGVAKSRFAPVITFFGQACPTGPAYQHPGRTGAQEWASAFRLPGTWRCEKVAHSVRSESLS